MNVNIIEAINLLRSYKEEEDPAKLNEMHMVLVSSIIGSSALPTTKDLSTDEVHGVTFSLDNNLFELFEGIAENHKNEVGWKKDFLNKAVMHQAIKEIDLHSLSQKDELMIEEPSFKKVLEMLFDYKQIQDKNILTNLHITLVRLLLEHRIMNTEGTTVGEISTPVHFKMDEDLFNLFNNMSEGKETGWKRNFLNRAVFNEILKVIEEKKFK